MAETKLTLISFGFRYGIPEQAGLVLDARGLENPFYVPQLKELSGLDREVEDYIFSFSDSGTLYEAFVQLIRLELRLYGKKEKETLCVAVGCTGGRHRSVAMAQRLYASLCAQGYDVTVYHRDLKKERERRPAECHLLPT